MKSALVLIDMQNDYFPGGSMPLEGVNEAAERAQKILHSFRNRHLPVFHIMHVSLSPETPFMLPDSRGVEINEKVKSIAGEFVVKKHFPNAFRETSLLPLLKENEVNDLVFCGAMSHMCVDTTVRAAFDLGFGCTVIEDGCATMDLTYHGEIIKAATVHGAYMAALAFPFARVMDARAFLAEVG